MKGKQDASVGIVIPTLNAEKDLLVLLPILFKSTVEFKCLIIDSSSSDKTVEVAKGFNVDIIVIDKSEFNHGLTREKGRMILDTDIIVMLTQDIIPANCNFLEKLIEPIRNGDAQVAYARQVPHDGAGLSESYPREFNYPAVNELRSINDINTYGVYTFFCSDSCSAYSNTALNEIGGFQKCITHEDYFAVVKLLSKGHKIAYVSKSVVKHSHKYTFKQEFKRYYDAGYSRYENANWLKEIIIASNEERGRKMIMGLLKRASKGQPLAIPSIILQSFVKYLGFYCGNLGNKIPIYVRKKITTIPHYFE